MPVVFTRGFNPHIRIEAGWALPTGFSSGYEVSETEMAEELSVAEFIIGMNRELSKNAEILDAAFIPMPHTKLSRLAKEHFIHFEIDFPWEKEIIPERLAMMKEYKKVTPKRETVLDLNSYIQAVDYFDGKLSITYEQKEVGARIQDIIQGLTGFDVRKAVTLNPVVIKRFVEESGAFTDLLDV